MASPPPSNKRFGLAARPEGIVSVADGKRVRIKGVNLFGLETETFSIHGLWSVSLDAILDSIASNGFNTVRLPFSAQLALGLDTLVATGINTSANPALTGATGGKVMDEVIKGCLKRNLLVMPDLHRLKGTGSITELWYDDAEFPEERVIQAWLNVVRRYKEAFPNVFAADLKNEPHGIAAWGGSDPKLDWASAAERIGNAILKENPRLLIVVEGVERYGNDGSWWGGSLAGVTARPVKLSVPERLVYSPHVYGPDVFMQEYFKSPDFPNNLEAIWQRHFGFLLGKAPLIVGEWGGKYAPDSKDRVWQNKFGEWLRKNAVDWTYWCWNVNSADTGGLVKEDWTTPETDKLALLARVCPDPTKFTFAATAVTTTTTTGTPLPQLPQLPPLTSAPTLSAPLPDTATATTTATTTTNKKGYRITLVKNDTWKDDKMSGWAASVGAYEVQCVNVSSKPLKVPQFKVTCSHMKSYWNVVPQTPVNTAAAASATTTTTNVFSYVPSTVPSNTLIQPNAQIQPPFGFVASGKVTVEIAADDKQK